VPSLARNSFRSALITGASSGLGAALARELCLAGTRVVLAARRTDRLEELADELRAAGGSAEVEPLDVADADAVGEVLARRDADAGGLDLVLANAGVGGSAGADPLSVEAIERVIDVNVRGAALTLALARPLLVARGRGTLAATSSLAYVRGMPGSGAYSASKAFLSTFLETLRLDLDGTGVRVVDLRPGFVRTEMTAGRDGAMPFLMDVEPAARVCVSALERGKPIAAFPAGAWWISQVGIRHLPRGLWQWTCRRMGWR
jgi:NADP-dependent 3-hydroxy acid dehydrogenase YdfG